MSRMILITFFSLLLLTGCHHTNPINKVWKEPKKPVLVQPTFYRDGVRLYLNKENAVLLRNNILELKAYESKLEFLIKEMKNYYTK